MAPKEDLLAEACASTLYYMCFFEKQEGPWLPGTLTSRDLSCVSEPGLNWECKTGRALLAGGWEMGRGEGGELRYSMGKGTKEE